ncbi:MAG: PSD1 and planctomycete cytochrome C domain-containing protein [Planctomycetota bacterium]|nr:PSD1 and planctomycete cytochrome C domain-containing protein [Planctomycetota bacterium]
MLKLRLFVCAFMLIPLVVTTTLVATEEIPAEIEFNRDIRPLLSDHCFACHGPDKNKREADLRLDTEVGILGGDESSGIVKPGEPEASELWNRVSTDDFLLKMPPTDFGKDLSPRDLKLLKRWIEQGAKWEGHWSFEPIRRPDIPAVTAAHPIDAFIVAELETEGLKPSAPAEKETLIRRVTFDLTGLPPTPDEVAAFLDDDSDVAYERVVDRLLASPRYGERMAMWWLDLVRYADSVVYHGDQPVSVFAFREYVIDSFNRNKPFDQFTLEQLAGDLLPEPTTEQLIASGYNRLGMMSAEGGVQPKEYLAKYIAERVRNLGGTWLGATLGCCECHDHKYDPFTMKDFYSLEAFFADIEEHGLYSGAHATGAWGPQIKLPSAAQQQELARLQQEIADATTTLKTPTPELDQAQNEWESSFPRWTPLTPATFSAANGSQLTLQDDASLLASGPRPDTETYTVVIENPPAGVSAIRLDVLPDESLPAKGAGRADGGNFVLSEFAVNVSASGESPTESVTLQNASASYEQPHPEDKGTPGKFSATASIDGDKDGATPGWAIQEKVTEPQHAVFEPVNDLAGGEGVTWTITLNQNYSSAGHLIGRFRIQTTSAARPVEAFIGGAAIETIVFTPSGQRTTEQVEALAAYYRSVSPLLDPVRAHLAQVEKARNDLDQALPTTLITKSVEPRMVRILPRGNWMDDKGDPLAPAFPGILPQGESTSSSRMTRVDLANWITSAENPLTARVFANRMWKLFFGAGLSRRIDDLGAQGEWPSHPQLLDYLAGRFIDSGWNVKQLVKEIVMSRAYRQTSLVDPTLRELDPANRLLARQGRFRFDAETVRDNALAVSGLLVEEVGGPSVKPYQPPGYWAYLNFPAREWQNSSGAELYRRGLYTHWQRQYLHPSLLAFDAPSREECTAERSRSNTPLQSLVLLNDPSYVEASRAFAESIIRQGGTSTHERLDWAFHRALSRSIRPQEREVLEELFASHLSEYQADQESAKQLISVGNHQDSDEVDAAELAAWTNVARTIFNLHEFITRN